MPSFYALNGRRAIEGLDYDLEFVTQDELNFYLSLDPYQDTVTEQAVGSICDELDAIIKEELYD